MDLAPVVTGVLAGTGTGVLAGLTTPWAQWAVEKRREKRTHQRAEIEKWRAMVARDLQRNLLSDAVQRDPDFLSLRPHLSDTARAELEHARGTTIISGGQGVAANYNLSIITGEIDRLEREWKLA